MLVRALYLWVSIQQDEEDTNKPTDKQTDKPTENDKESDSDVPGDHESETVLRKLNVKNPEKDEETNKYADKSKDTDSDSKVPGDDKSETVLRKRNVKKAKKDVEERKSTKEKLSDTEVPGDEKEKAFKHQDSRMSVVNIGANYLLVHLIGYGMMNTPKLFTYIGKFILLFVVPVKVQSGILISRITRITFIFQDPPSI